MNTKKDLWDEMAEEMLPCELVTMPMLLPTIDATCATCYRRPAVAAKLREMGEEIAKLKAENEGVIFELLRIGDRAVVNWDDATVGEVARAGAVPTKTYIEMRRAELAQWKAIYKSVAEMGAEIEKLKAEKLAEAERVTGFINEVIVWTPRGGHTLGCNCGAYWCERRKEILEAEQAKEREE